MKNREDRRGFFARPGICINAYSQQRQHLANGHTTYVYVRLGVFVHGCVLEFGFKCAMVETDFSQTIYFSGTIDTLRMAKEILSFAASCSSFRLVSFEEQKVRRGEIEGETRKPHAYISLGPESNGVFCLQIVENALLTAADARNLPFTMGTLTRNASFNVCERNSE
jgi:hypothetical protein